MIKSYDEFVKNWNDPDALYRSAPFWSWNGKLHPEKLCRQIESMHTAGMGGFFMHSRSGLKTPYLGEEWFSCVSACIDKARSLGMKAYIYDEDKYSSGFAGGAVTRNKPQNRAKVLVLRRPVQLKNNEARLASYKIMLDEDRQLILSSRLEQNSGIQDTFVFDVIDINIREWYNDAYALDTMNKEAVADFLDITYKAYYDRFGEYFGNVIPAVFTDEVCIGWLEHGFEFKDGIIAAVHWTADLQKIFAERRKYDITNHLPELFFPLKGEKFSKVAYDHRLTLFELLNENFFGQISQWCIEHKIKLTGHIYQGGTNTAILTGLPMPIYAKMGWPGVDVLTDKNTIEWKYSTVKYCTSAANQLGHERALSETYGVTGWDWPLEGHKYMGDWQYASGINFRCPHLTHYTLAGYGKVDYPGSISHHSPWWKYYKILEDYFARLGYMFLQGKPVADVLVLCRLDTVWGFYRGYHKDGGNLDFQEHTSRYDKVWEQLVKYLTGIHIGWDYGDEILLEKFGRTEGATLKVGVMAYRLVIVPPGLTIHRSTLRLLKELVCNGGNVIFLAPASERVDAEESNEAEVFAKKSTYVSSESGEMFGQLMSGLTRRIYITEDGNEQTCIWHMLRETDEGYILFLQSHDRKLGHKIHINVEANGFVAAWNPVDGKRRQVPHSYIDGRTEFDVFLVATGSALFTIGVKIPDALPPDCCEKVVNRIELHGPFDIVREELNALPLDYCTCETDNELIEDIPVLEADKVIRNHFGLKARSFESSQPWYLYSTGKIGIFPLGFVKLAFTFHVSDLPSICKVVMEYRDDYTIRVNGEIVGVPDGYWIDEDFKTIEIIRHIKAGMNKIVLEMNYCADMEIENIYIIGDFGIDKLDARLPRQPGNTTLVRLSGRLSLGSWVGQGLDFYTSSVYYRMNVKKPETAHRVRLYIEDINCTAIAMHVNGKIVPVLWKPYKSDITDLLFDGENEVMVEVIGGRRNIFGPLHVSEGYLAEPGDFYPDNKKWNREYQLSDHGINSPIIIEYFEIPEG